MIITIINCHISNRGDEAAIHSLVDEIIYMYPDVRINLLIRGDTIYPNMPDSVRMLRQFIPGDFRSLIAFYVALLTRGKIKVSSSGKRTLEAMQEANIILHAPGGPSIGDTYYNAEPTYLRLYDLARVMNKPYMFYAPSMGPFERKERNRWRKRIIGKARAVVLRDPISAEHVRRLLPNKKLYQTLDSALQHDIDYIFNQSIFEQYIELKKFISSHKKCIGVTITDLSWHPIHSKNTNIRKGIQDTFLDVIDNLTKDGYGIVFIPQLYGSGNDYDLMKTYCLNDENYFIIPANEDRYDAYFQQYLIGQLYAVIGMRYHSNIFSAKMGTPFISVSYEQKMQGFMEKMDLLDYCIRIDDLSVNNLKEKFDILVNNYDEYKKYLKDKHDDMKREAYKTTEILQRTIKDLGNDR